MKITGETSDGYHTFNELYDHRHALFLALMTADSNKIWCAKQHEDGTMFDGMFIAGMTVNGQDITYHLPLDLYALTCSIPGISVLERAPTWDGHSSTDVVDRLIRYVKSKSTPKVAATKILVKANSRQTVRDGGSQVYDVVNSDETGYCSVRQDFSIGTKTKGKWFGMLNPPNHTYDLHVPLSDDDMIFV